MIINLNCFSEAGGDANKLDVTVFNQYVNDQATIDESQNAALENLEENKLDKIGSWIGSKIEYDELEEKLPNTVYYITSDDIYTLRFKSLEDGQLQVKNLTADIDLEYSFDNINYTKLTVASPNVNVQNGDTIYLRGNNPNGLCKSSSTFITINNTGKTMLSGNIMSLIYPTESQNTNVIPNDYCFTKLFDANDGLDLNIDFKMTAKVLKPYCYSNMFRYMKSLTYAGFALKAKSVPENSYRMMFREVPNLKVIPNIISDVIGENACYYMFYKCPSIDIIENISIGEVETGGLYYAFANSSVKQIKNLILNKLSGNNSALSAFSNCKNLESIDNIYIGDISAQYGAQNLFNGCTNLKTVNGIIGNTISSDNALAAAFANCSSLVNAPELPATTLATNCYFSMFSYCSSLVNTPELPATTLADACYQTMFSNCTSLVNTPELPATTLAPNCYAGMFQHCESLINAPELPATTLAPNCYLSMFGYCSSLVNAPELPATTLADACYQTMFGYCTSLVNAPELPATTLAPNCYAGMFQVTALVNAPELPATELVESCYYKMFNNCESLVNAPELPATTLATNCYFSMFSACGKLNYIKVNAETWNTTNSKNWVHNVSSTGTFIKPATTNIPTGFDGIPEGWTVLAA